VTRRVGEAGSAARLGVLASRPAGLDSALDNGGDVVSPACAGMWDPVPILGRPVASTGELRYSQPGLYGHIQERVVSPSVRCRDRGRPSKASASAYVKVETRSAAALGGDGEHADDGARRARGGAAAAVAERNGGSRRDGRAGEATLWRSAEVVQEDPRGEARRDRQGFSWQGCLPCSAENTKSDSTGARRPR